MPRLYQCPCCGADTAGRTNPITPEEARAAYRRMLHRGLTRDQMLAEYRDIFDAIAPGFIAWIEANTRARQLH